MTSFTSKNPLAIGIGVLAVAGLGVAAYAIASEDFLPGLLARDLRKADRMVVRKKMRKLALYREDDMLAEYAIALGAAPVGHKKKEGDERTPEGEYVIDWRNEKSGYYKSLHISYPNKEDEANARARGESPGGLIMIHGQKNRFGWLAPLTQRSDWTDGCIAVTNSEMEEIWRSVDDGTPILIEP